MATSKTLVDRFSPHDEGDNDAHDLIHRTFQQTHQLERQQKCWRIVRFGALLFFVTMWVLLVPLILIQSGIDETSGSQWDYPAALYYAVQAGLGIGFGVLSVDADSLRALMIFHLTFGSLCVAAGLATLIQYFIDKADLREKTHGKSAKAKRLQGALVAAQGRNAATAIGTLPGDMGAMAAVAALEASANGESPNPPWRELANACFGLFILLTAGVLYGVLYEKWTFIKALYFCVSAFQTSGEEAPSVAFSGPAFPPLFVAALCILGVPTWGYTIGKLAQCLLALQARQRALDTMYERELEAEKHFLQLRAESAAAAGTPIETAPADDDAVADEAETSRLVLVDGFEFLQLWLLRSGLVDADTLEAVRAEFEMLKLENEPRDAVDLWRVSARLRFLQLLRIGVAKPEEWTSFAHALSANGRKTDELRLRAARLQHEADALLEQAERLQRHDGAQLHDRGLWSDRAPPPRLAVDSTTSGRDG